MLGGCTKLLKERRIRAIQIEFGGCSYDARIFLKDFFDILPDFDFYKLIRDGKIFLGTYKESYEKYTTNYVCELRDI